MDLSEVPIAGCQRSLVANDPIAMNAQEIGEEFVVGVAPGGKVASHWIDSEVVKKLASLKKLEERAFPMIKGIAEVGQIHSISLSGHWGKQS
jgi:hypothetical protein